MNDPHAPQFTRDYLTDGYISYTFSSRNAESYLVHLFKVDAPLVQAIRHQSGAFYVLNRPSHNSPPALLVNGQDAWLLDYAVRTGGSVVPQLWFPQGQGDRRRYVDQAQFRMPIFFVNAGSLGVPVTNAAAGHMQLNGTDLPPQLADKTTIKIRIGVCTRSLPRRSHHLPYVSQWPGYAPSEHQVLLKDQTPARNLVSLERLVKHVGSRVRLFLEVSFVPNVAKKSEIERFLGMRAQPCARTDLELDCWTWKYYLR
jgi:hypothetical protein